MAQDFARKFYNSKAWRHTQKLFKQSKFGICELCNKPHGHMIVHHKINLTEFNINNPDISLNWDNLQLLCITCHNKEHQTGVNILESKGLAFDENGNLVISTPVKL